MGGSGLWAIRSDFFKDIGFLDLKQLVGHNKKHDQLYWRLLDKSTRGKPYIMGLGEKLGIHCGGRAGSVCNKLTKHRGSKDKLDQIKFIKPEQNIENIDFDTFFKSIYNDKKLINGW